MLGECSVAFGRARPDYACRTEVRSSSRFFGILRDSSRFFETPRDSSRFIECRFWMLCEGVGLGWGFEILRHYSRFPELLRECSNADSGCFCEGVGLGWKFEMFRDSSRFFVIPGFGFSRARLGREGAQSRALSRPNSPTLQKGLAGGREGRWKGAMGRERSRKVSENV